MKIFDHRVFGGLILLLSGLVQFTASEHTSFIVFLIVLAIISILSSRIDITSINFAFSIPWILILILSRIEISDYVRPVGNDTYIIVLASIGTVMLLAPKSKVLTAHPISNEHINEKRFKLAVVFFLCFAAFNIVNAGFIPLGNVLLGLDSGYMEFGLKGIYGIFNAFSNALGVLSIYFWLKTKRKIFLTVYFIIVAAFILFLTRQNIISLFVESFIIYLFFTRKIPYLKVALLILAFVGIFGALGDLRLGKDISDIALIKPEFEKLPSALLWIYSYCYFNLLNLDNIVGLGGSRYDLSSFSQLLPSFLRPQIEGDSNLLEVSSFTVGSFLSPIYADTGLVGAMTVLVFFCILAWRYSRSISREGSFEAIAGYSVIFFCFLFSFFENFWFYLPVIFQLVFIKLFGRILLKTTPRGRM